jgi:hypothetical protein
MPAHDQDQRVVSSSKQYHAHMAKAPTTSEEPAGLKVVGSRITDVFSWDDVKQLTLTAEVLRGTPRLVPKGVYRFETFEEADRWMIEKMALTHARHGRTMSPGSAER